jgi:hypothetical protein
LLLTKVVNLFGGGERYFGFCDTWLGRIAGVAKLVDERTQELRVAPETLELWLSLAA